MYSPVRVRNRTVRRRSVAVQWSLFPRELSVGQVLSLSVLWRGHDCRTKTVVCTTSPQGQRADFSMPILLCQSFSCGYAVCSGLFLAGISWSVRGALISEGCLVGDYSLHFCAWSQLASYFWWAFGFWLLLLASLFRQLIGHFVSMYAGMCRYPLKYSCCSWCQAV